MIGRIAIVASTFVTVAACVLACAGGKKTVPVPPPGPPAYWESQVPEEPRQPDPSVPPPPGTRYENWPSGVPGSSEGGGRTDKFLWEDEAPPPSVAPAERGLPAGPESQVPLRPPAAEQDKADAGSDGGDGGLPP